jgi:hypothetical protein
MFHLLFESCLRKRVSANRETNEDKETIAFCQRESQEYIFFSYISSKCLDLQHWQWRSTGKAKNNCMKGGNWMRLLLINWTWNLWSLNIIASETRRKLKVQRRCLQVIIMKSATYSGKHWVEHTEIHSFVSEHIVPFSLIGGKEMEWFQFHSSCSFCFS